MLAAIAGRGRWLLVAGLAAGLAWPAAAEAVRPLVGPIVAALLFLAMLRIGPAGIRTARRDLVRAALTAAAFQSAAPLCLAAVLAAAGLLSTPLGLGAVIILAAAPITGAAHIAVMAGGDPSPALRQTVIGTALLPLTIIPVLSATAAFGAAGDVAGPVLRLLGIVIAAGGAAAALCATGLVRDTPGTTAAIDAVAAVLLGVVVVGLMSAAAETIRSDPPRFATTLAAVSGLAFALQAVTARLWPDAASAVPMAVAAGNRNVALFLGILPQQVIDDTLLVIGCYQIPMYLTPLVLPRLLPRRV